MRNGSRRKAVKTAERKSGGVCEPYPARSFLLIHQAMLVVAFQIIADAAVENVVGVF